MNLFARFVDKPVQAIVISLVIALLGAQAIWRLNIREYPESTSATITVLTPYIGASAETVRGFITTPLEQVVATIDGIDYLKSASSQGQSTITVRLVLGYDPNAAVAQILTKIQQVSNRLPESAENSIVTVSTGNDQAAMYLAFLSDELEPSRISDYLNRAVRPRLETLPGIQEARVFGAQSLALRVWLDPRKMAALGVSAAEVREALAANNFLSALGDIKGRTLSVSLSASTDLDSVESFRRLVVREQGNALVRLEDIAQVRLGAESYDSSVLFDGKPAVFVAVSVTPTANLLDAVAEVRRILPDLQKQLPSEIKSLVVYDSTVAVQDSIGEVISALLQALAIVTVVIILFLGSLRAALVPGIAMPLAIVGAFFLMQLLGYSINLLTLLALILAIGTVVDDGIVIAENATRHIENGANPDEAARRTIKELAGAIVAMNIIVLAVFAPIGFMGGLTGRLFTEFAYTVAGATLISGVVALTLSPMMCAVLLKQDTGRIWGTRWVEGAFDKTSSGYRKLLAKALDLRWIVVGLGAVVFASVYFLYNAADRELAPADDGGFLTVSAQADPNSSLDQLEKWTSQLADQVKQFAPVEHAFVVNGGGPGNAAGAQAFGGVVLKDWADREQTQSAFQPKLQQVAAGSAGLQAVVISPPSLPGAGGGAPVQFIVSAIESPRAVFENAEALVQQAMRSGKFTFIRSDLKFDRQQIQVDIDREKAAALGVDIRRLSGDLSTMLSGGYVNFFNLDGRSYRVVPQLDRQFRLRPEQLEDLYVAARGDGLVPLSSFAKLNDSVEPRELLRFNQLNSATLSGVPAPGVSIGQAVETLQQLAADTLPAAYVTDWAGQSRQFVSESAALLVSFGLAIALMYLTLAAQYGSFRDPLVMLASVPMSLAGALLFFALGVVSVNIYTQIGLLALIGSIIRHGILLVEFGNDLQKEEGLDRRAAIEKAAELRLRSILMTTFATLFGLIPLLVASSGPGAQSRFAISFTLGVGMLIGTVFTLFVVPALYTLIATDHRKREEVPDGEREVRPQPQPQA